ncbi:hypothetical protein [Clostridium estertheticum]|uniref:hypothetical protein n=1 Tax=Clostridium estertheticum TaxID=238834 RepID=UPI001C6F1481|nr:hypothetical protein [Clostridium estertheticum]MBW9154250.1 hypothetical protein [Clostridium estertheticum]WLC86679.1 hypothetical protein KTC97_21895 [Clostridium estertheticum]
MEKYTEIEVKEFNAELKKLQNKASKLILSDYYDGVRLSELQYSILTQITNAESYKDINSYLWSTGLMQTTLTNIAEQIRELKKVG